MVVVAWRKKKLFLYKQLISAFIYDTFFFSFTFVEFSVFVFLFFFVFFVLLEVKLKAGKTRGVSGSTKKHFYVAARGMFN